MNHFQHVLLQGRRVFTLTLVFSTITVPMFFAYGGEKDQTTGGELLRFKGHQGWVPGLAFSPSGCRLVTGGKDRTVRVWDTQTGKEIRRLEGHTDEVYSVAYSPDGRQIVSAGWDGMIRFWDVQTGTELRHIKADEEGVRYVSFSVDGDKVVSGGLDRSVRIWDARKGKELARMSGHEDAIQSVAFFPDGRHVVSAGEHSLRIWDARTGREAGRLGSALEQDAFTSMALSPDGRYILSGKKAKEQDSPLELWEVKSAGLATNFHSPNVGYHFQLSGGEPLRRFTGHTRDVHAVAITRDCRRALSGSGTLGYELFVFNSDKDKIPRDDTLRLWDLKTGREVKRFRGHTNGIISVSLSPDGRHAVSSSFDNTVRLWKLGD
jgi:WD40 repeat protein